VVRGLEIILTCNGVGVNKKHFFDNFDIKKDCCNYLKLQQPILQIVKFV